MKKNHICAGNITSVFWLINTCMNIRKIYFSEKSRIMNVDK